MKCSHDPHKTTEFSGKYFPRNWLLDIAVEFKINIPWQDRSGYLSKSTWVQQGKFYVPLSSILFSQNNSVIHCHMLLCAYLFTTSNFQKGFSLNHAVQVFLTMYVIIRDTMNRIDDKDYNYKTCAGLHKKLYFLACHRLIILATCVPIVTSRTFDLVHFAIVSN